MNKNKGFSLIELLIVVAIILIIAAIAIPNLLRSKMSANQAATVATIRNINSSEVGYISEFNQMGYADTFAKLGPGVPCDATHACMLDELVGCVAQPCIKSGYGYFLLSTSGAAPFPDFASSSTPVGWGSSGQANFCSMDDFVLRQQITSVGKLAGAVLRSVCVDGTQYSAIK